MVAEGGGEDYYRIKTKNENSFIKLHNLTSFQTSKSFIHLLNTDEDIFDEIRELSDPA